MLYEVITTCDIDVRDYVDIVSIMNQYDLGPNGALIMANDLIASKIDEIQNEVNRVNPDYLIVDVITSYSIHYTKLYERARDSLLKSKESLKDFLQRM